MASKRKRMRMAADALRHLLDDERITADLSQDEIDHATLLQERLYLMVNRLPVNGE